MNCLLICQSNQIKFSPVFYRVDNLLVKSHKINEVICEINQIKNILPTKCI
nr:MAG TPA: hypothetical protein [Caudoviricetes sp.]